MPTTIAMTSVRAHPWGDVLAGHRACLTEIPNRVLVARCHDLAPARRDGVGDVAGSFSADVPAGPNVSSSEPLLFKRHTVNASS
jgi:hypothetical protein